MVVYNRIDLRLKGANMNLSKLQRLFLYNQYLILEKLYPEDAKLYSMFRKVLNDGYTLEYSTMFQIFDEEMTEEECKEVYDILDMYDALYNSFDRLPDKSLIDKDKIHFDGFDGNNESEQRSYALFLIYDLGKYEKLRDVKNKYDSLNSHSWRLDKYRTMLSVWKSIPIENRYELNAQQIQEILKAPYPKKS